MAEKTKIRGITIEIGADTTGLTKGLSTINSEISNTQKQLRDVERLLKIDPGNTELLEQKQRLLNDRIEETKTKLTALKETRKQVGEAMTESGGKEQEQYDALTREIVYCENELKNLQKEASKSQQALEKIGEAGEKIKNAGDKISGVGRSLAPVSTAAAGIAAGIVKTTADFDTSMSKVQAISGATGSDFDALRDKAREMGATTKFTASEAAEALNYMAMAGWKTDEMLNGIEGIMHLAAASGEELGTTSDIVTDALTAFGMKAEESGRFADILAAAAANANTNVGMMGESFKYAAPVAGSLGYSAEDVAVALGLMANSGIKASMAGTSLRNMFNRMAKPTKESDAAMERLGISLQDDEGRMYSFREIMDQLRKSMTTINMPLAEYNRQLDILDEDLEAGRIKQSAYDKELEELNKQAFGAEGAEKARAAAMLGGTRAMAGLLAIANATEEDYNQLTNAIDNSSQAFARTKDGVVPLNEALASGAEVLETYEGSAAAMAATMLDNVEGQFTILKSQLSELAISLGDTLMPTLREVIGYIQDFVDKLNGMDEDTKKMIINIVLVTAALSPVLIIVGKLMTGIGSLMTVIGGLSAPILAVIAVIAALVAAFVHLWNTNDEFRENILKTWERIKTTFSEFGQGIVDRLNKMGFEFKDFGEVVGAVWNGLCSVLAPLFEVAFKTVGDILDASLKLLTGIFDFWVGLFSGDWEQMWNGLVETFEAIFGGLANIFDDILGGIVAGINGITSGIRKVSKGKIDIPEIKWMAEGGVLTNGTAIVGEAGAELLTVQNGQAVVQPLGSQSGTSELQSLLREYLPYLKMKQDIILDGDTLVGHTAPRMNEALGEIRSRETYA